MEPKLITLTNAFSKTSLHTEEKILSRLIPIAALRWFISLLTASEPPVPKASKLTLVQQRINRGCWPVSATPS